MKAALRSRWAQAGLVILAIFVLVAALAPVIAPYSPTNSSFSPLASPSLRHLLGTTQLGQDIFSQLVWGTRGTLEIGFLTGLFATALGVLVGIGGGYLGGPTDSVLNALTNVFLVIPGLPLIIITAAYITTKSQLPIILIISFTGWAWGARVLRSQTLSLRQREFILAARLVGESPLRIVVSEVLPNMLSLIAANFIGAAIYGILSAAGLQFIGLGNVNAVTWGTMLFWAQSQGALLSGAWLWILAPGAAIALVGTALGMLNFGIDELTNPRLRAGVKKLPKPVPAGTPEVGALLSLQEIEAGYQTAAGPLTAVRGVSLAVKPGEFLGIAGESGCGKSTLAFAALGLLRPPGAVYRGSSYLAGVDLLALTPAQRRPYLWRDASFVFQASMNALNPVIRVRDHVLDTARAHGLPPAEAIERATALLQQFEIPAHFLDAYSFQLSGGMKQRVVLALSLLLRPKLILMDEPTTALDVVVQRLIMQQIEWILGELGVSIVFITHDFSLLVEISDRIAIMYAGTVVEQGPAAEIYAHPLHPYTQGLIRSFPPMSGERQVLHGIPGHPPGLGEKLSGCPFFARCSARLEGVCDQAVPALLAQGDQDTVACHLYGQPPPVAAPTAVGEAR